MPDSGPTAPVSFSTLARYRLALIRDADEIYHPAQAPPYRPSAAAQLLNSLLHESDGHVLGALFLDSHRRPMGHSLARPSSGSWQQIETRSFFATALLLNASSLVLFRRRPHSDPSPSDEDLAFAARTREAGEVLGIQLVDHLILGAAVDQWQSLRQHQSWMLTGVTGNSRSRSPRPHRRPLREPQSSLSSRAIDGRSRVQPKYRDPVTGETWSGRGKMARWLKLKIAGGEKREDYLIERDG